MSSGVAIRMVAVVLRSNYPQGVRWKRYEGTSQGSETKENDWWCVRASFCESNLKLLELFSAMF